MTDDDAVQLPGRVPRRPVLFASVRNILRVENLLWERWLGISTRGVSGSPPDDWSESEHIYYSTVAYREIFRIFDFLSLNRSDVVVDIGCGRGRVLCCAALYDVADVIGLDDTEEMCTAAEENLRRMRRRRARAAVIRGKAEGFDYSRGTVYYMYHPFGAGTMRAVLARLGEIVQRTPQPRRIVYVNPVHEAVLEDTPWLECYARWPRSDTVRFTGFEHAVSFWRTRASD